MTTQRIYQVLSCVDIFNNTHAVDFSDCKPFHSVYTVKKPGEMVVISVADSDRHRTFYSVYSKSSTIMPASAKEEFALFVWKK